MLSIIISLLPGRLWASGQGCKSSSFHNLERGLTIFRVRVCMFVLFPSVFVCKFICLSVFLFVCLCVWVCFYVHRWEEVNKFNQAICVFSRRARDSYQKGHPVGFWVWNQQHQLSDRTYRGHYSWKSTSICLKYQSSWRRLHLLITNITMPII